MICSSLYNQERWAGFKAWSSLPEPHLSQDARCLSHTNDSSQGSTPPMPAPTSPGQTLKNANLAGQAAMRVSLLGCGTVGAVCGLHQPAPAGTNAHSLPGMARPAVGPRQHFSCLSRRQGTASGEQPRNKAANRGIEIPFNLCLSAPHPSLQVSSGPLSIIQTPVPTPANSTWKWAISCV